MRESAISLLLMRALEGVYLRIRNEDVDTLPLFSLLSFYVETSTKDDVESIDIFLCAAVDRNKKGGKVCAHDGRQREGLKPILCN